MYGGVGKAVVYTCTFKFAAGSLNQTMTCNNGYMTMARQMGMLAGVLLLLFTAAPAFAQSPCPALSLGSSGPAVTKLQQFLGSEYSNFTWVTGYFGPITEAAVKQWQEEYGIVSSGSPATTGWGVVGPRTAPAMKLCSASAAANITVAPTLVTSAVTTAKIEALKAEVKRLTEILASLVAKSRSTSSSPALSAGGGGSAGSVPQPARSPTPPPTPPSSASPGMPPCTIDTALIDNCVLQ